MLTLPKTIGPYVLNSRLGSGGFAIVYLAVHEITELPVAVKVIEKAKVDRQKLEREISLMDRIDHPYCVEFFEFLEDDLHYYLVLEYCEGGTLLARVNQAGRLNPLLIRKVVGQVCCAIDYIHNVARVAHRDLKLENIMFDRHDNIRVIDFGLGNVFAGNGMLATACGSTAYAPPEMLRGKAYTSEADVWGLGIMTYAMTYGKLPWWNSNQQTLAEYIVRTEAEFPRVDPPDLVDLVKRMLAKNEKARITVKGIREHMFLARELASGGVSQGFENEWMAVGNETVIDRIQRRHRVTDEVNVRLNEMRQRATARQASEIGSATSLAKTRAARGGRRRNAMSMKVLRDDTLQGAALAVIARRRPAPKNQRTVSPPR